MSNEIPRWMQQVNNAAGFYMAASRCQEGNLWRENFLFSCLLNLQRAANCFETPGCTEERIIRDVIDQILDQDLVNFDEMKTKLQNCTRQLEESNPKFDPHLMVVRELLKYGEPGIMNVHDMVTLELPSLKELGKKSPKWGLQKLERYEQAEPPPSTEEITKNLVDKLCLLPDHNGKKCLLQRGHMGMLHDGSLGFTTGMSDVPVLEEHSKFDYRQRVWEELENSIEILERYLEFAQGASLLVEFQDRLQKDFEFHHLAVATELDGFIAGLKSRAPLKVVREIAPVIQALLACQKVLRTKKP